MTTKTHSGKPEKKDPIPDLFLTIRETIKYLESFHFDISYDGLSYYRTMGIIEEPVRFKGHMDKFYYIPDLWRHITTAKLLTSLLNLRLEDLPVYIKVLPKDIYLTLPSTLLKTYGKVWGFKRNLGGVQNDWVDTLYDTLCIGMKKVLNKVTVKVKPGISERAFADLLEKETQRFKETRKTTTLLADKY